MDEDQAKQLGEHLQNARKLKGFSARELSELTGMADSSIVRIELGMVAEPRPDKLKRIAEALELSTADIFERAGYATATDLPTMQPYLRTKYGLPPEAMDEIEKSATRIAKKYGMSLEGPAPGEDEN